MKLRIMQIIKFLLKTHEAVTIDSIAEELGVSNKTIRNDFKTVEQILKGHNLKLVKKTGVGVFVDGESKDKLTMLSEANSYKSDKSKLSSRDRQLYILNQLLNCTKRTSITGLEEELFISRPSVYKDLAQVKEWLAERDIDLEHVPRKGLFINAGEKRIRKSLFDLFLISNEHDELIDLLETNGGSFNYYSYDQKEDIGVIDFDVVQSIIKKYEEALDVIFTANGLARLTIKYCISINRIMDGYSVTLLDDTLKRLSGLERYKTMLDLVSELSQEFGIDFKKEEICYLFGMTLGTKTHYDQKHTHFNPEVMAIITIITQEIVNNTKKKYNIKNEDAFYNGLLHHMKTVTNKLQYGLDFYNDFLEDIIVGYPEAYQIAMKSKRLFEEFYNFDIPQAEIGFITLHIASAIERSKCPLSVCVVYSNSYSEIKLMMEFLHNRYKQLDLKRVIPKSLYKEHDYSEYDLVIATEKLDQIDSEKLVVLPSILVHKDMSEFTTLLNNIYETYNEKLLKKDE